MGNYLRKPVKDCEFSDRQLIHNTLNTLILILGYVVLNKIYLIFQRLQKEKEKKRKKFFSLVGNPSPSQWTVHYKKGFSCGFPKLLIVIHRVLNYQTILIRQVVLRFYFTIHAKLYYLKIGNYR